jgi:hypothetical protein
VVFQCLYRQMGVFVMFLWVPAHVGVEGKEEVNGITKQALKHPIVN